MNFDLIDGFTKVTDKDAAVYTQRLAKEEGMFLGNSAGAAIKGVLQLKEHFTTEIYEAIIANNLHKMFFTKTQLFKCRFSFWDSSH